MPGKSYSGDLPPLTGEQRELAGRLKGHVEKLAVDIGERNVWRYEKLVAAASYIEHSLSSYGYTVFSPSYRVNSWQVSNLVAELKGSERGDEIIVVGAHYDTTPGTPGANDNASGVAALLELARLFAAAKPQATIRFVAFVNEEPPFFQTAQMGSRVYAHSCKEKGEKIIAMLSLETIGYFSDAEGSQHYPFPIAALYPDTGNFIGFVGNQKSRELTKRCVEIFRKHTSFPSEGAAFPDAISGIGWSDHWSFWQEGYEAVMVTDTAPFRYEHYHTIADTPEKLDYERMARVVEGVGRVISGLGSGR